MNEHYAPPHDLGKTSAGGRAGPRCPAWLRWLGRQMVPNIGTLLLVAVLLFAFPSLAAPLRGTNATSTTTIPYQGRLADAEENPLTGSYDMVFRLYTVPTGGTALWTESWTGTNAVAVSGGLFSVMLGTFSTTLSTVVSGQDTLYLGITVGTDSEMVPRVQLGSVPFSFQTLTVPDGSVTTAKLASEAVTNLSRVETTGAVSYSSSTWEDIPGLTMTVATGASEVHVFFNSGDAWNDTTGGGINFRILVDGQVKTFGSMGDFGYPALVRMAVPLSWAGSMGAGNHVIKAQWQTTSGTPGTAWLGGRANLTVIEYKR